MSWGRAMKGQTETREQSEGTWDQISPVHRWVNNGGQQECDEKLVYTFPPNQEENKHR